MMKHYIFVIVFSMGFVTIFTKHTNDQIKFHKKFLKWEKKNLSSLKTHKFFMNDLLASYNYYYQLVEKSDEKIHKDILNKLQDALQNIMNNWNFHYDHLPLKAFYDLVQIKYKNDTRFKAYFNAYEKYDKKPTDPKLKMKVQQEQANIEPMIQNLDYKALQHNSIM